MRDSILVEVVDSQQDLVEETARILVFETARLRNEVKGLAVRT
jgi:hypothetical protein